MIIIARKAVTVGGGGSLAHSLFLSLSPYTLHICPPA
jgi:hypothetical protein